MSKILCTLAFYHDGATRRPQLVVSTNPGTSLVMKGKDWKAARFSNTNATAGARNRFEYSFTGGKSVTRCSLVINTSTILPPFIWLSKHPSGPPTKTGPRGKPGLKATEEAKRKAELEKLKLEAMKDPKRIERAEMLAEHGIYEPSPRSRYLKEDKRLRIEDRPSSSSRRNNRYNELPPLYPADYEERIPDREKRREERQKRLRGSSSASTSSSTAAAAMAGTNMIIPDRETRRQERLKRLRSESSASESSDADRYRRSSRPNRHHSGRDRRRYHGGEYASGNSGSYRGEDDGDNGDGGGGDAGAGGD